MTHVLKSDSRTSAASIWVSDIFSLDFAKRLGRGKLMFTGDVLQVISVVGREQKFGKLLICITVGP
jgi:hypothetical protein